MLLNKLTKFYKNETMHLPHDPADLFEIGWELAEVLDECGEHSNAWKSPVGWDFREFVEALRTRPDAALIDIAVDMIHRELLAWAGVGEEDECLFSWYLGGDIVRYLLHRNDPQLREEAAAAAAREDELWG